MYFTVLAPFVLLDIIKIIIFNKKMHGLVVCSAPVQKYVHQTTKLLLKKTQLLGMELLTTGTPSSSQGKPEPQMAVQ